MPFKHQTTTPTLRQNLRAELFHASSGVGGPSGVQSITWGLLNDFEEALLLLRQCQRAMGMEGLGIDVQAFLRTRG